MGHGVACYCREPQVAHLSVAVVAGIGAVCSAAGLSLQPASLPAHPPLHWLCAAWQVLSRLSHPHIISFFGACLAPPNVCIVEELATGGSLHHRLHARRRGAKLYPRLTYSEVHTYIHINRQRQYLLHANPVPVAGGRPAIVLRIPAPCRAADACVHALVCL